MTTASKGIESSSRSSTASKVDGGSTSNLSKEGVLRDSLSGADTKTRDAIQAQQGAKALVDSSGVPLEKTASMTPSQFWSSKLGECYSKGISMADCTPWS